MEKLLKEAIKDQIGGELFSDMLINLNRHMLNRKKHIKNTIEYENYIAKLLIV